MKSIIFVPVDPAKPFWLPTRGSDHAVCFDLYASEGGRLPVAGRALVGTNLRVIVPIGWEMQIRSRSSAFKTGLRVFQGVGTIDPGFYDEVFVVLENVDSVPRSWESGDRIAQARFERVSPVEVMQGTEEDLALHKLVCPDRGGGCGSTGK